jgi:hypothetical protein
MLPPAHGALSAPSWTSAAIALDELHVRSDRGDEISEFRRQDAGRCDGLVQRLVQPGRLAAGDGLCGEDRRDVVEHEPQLVGGERAERLHVLLSRRRVTRVKRNGRGQRPVLRAQPDDRLVQRHEPASAACAVGGELMGERRVALVEQPGQPAFAEHTQLRHRHRRCVERERQCLAVKVAARVEALRFAVVGVEEERRVGDGAHLALGLRDELLDDVGDRTVHLRRHAQRDGRLREVEVGGVAGELSKSRRDRLLTGVTLHRCDARRVRAPRRAHQGRRQGRKIRRRREQQ